MNRDRMTRDVVSGRVKVEDWPSHMCQSIHRADKKRGRYPGWGDRSVGKALAVQA